MQFFTLLTLAAATAHATPLQSRADTAIPDALMPVLASLKSLDAAINGLTSDPQTALPILNASDSAATALTGASTKIQAADMLTLPGALMLQQTATGLTTQVQTTIGDLTSKKATLDQLGVTSVAVQALQKQKTASSGLTDAILSKVPAIAKPIAKKSTDMIGATLDMGIQMLSAKPATAAGGSTTGTAPATGSTAPKASGAAGAAPKASDPPKASAAPKPSTAPVARRADGVLLRGR